MNSPERQLRLVQVTCIFFILVCFFVKRMGTIGTHATITPFQWLMVLAAIWSATSGFTMQRRLNGTSTRLGKPSIRSTPLGRWKVGHLIRLATATAVGTWGLVLHYSGGPELLVDVFFGFSMLLLLIWSPAGKPDAAQQ